MPLTAPTSPESQPRHCPNCARPLKYKGSGRWVCPEHGEWLEPDPDDGQAQDVEPGDDYDPDPNRHRLMLSSQLRENGSGSNGVGRVRKKPPKHNSDPWREV